MANDTSSLDNVSSTKFIYDSLVCAVLIDTDMDLGIEESTTLLHTLSLTDNLNYFNDSETDVCVQQGV